MLQGLVGLRTRELIREICEAREIRITESEGYLKMDLFLRLVDGRIRVEVGTFGGFNSWKVERELGLLKKGPSLSIVAN